MKRLLLLIEINTFLILAITVLKKKTLLGQVMTLLDSKSGEYRDINHRDGLWSVCKRRNSTSVLTESVQITEDDLQN